MAKCKTYVAFTYWLTICPGHNITETIYNNRYERKTFRHVAWIRSRKDSYLSLRYTVLQGNINITIRYRQIACFIKHRSKSIQKNKQFLFGVSRPWTHGRLRFVARKCLVSDHALALFKLKHTDQVKLILFKKHQVN
jgi:hypothetical protein